MVVALGSGFDTSSRQRSTTTTKIITTTEATTTLCECSTRIAIVGAGFAGLTLANALQQHQQEQQRQQEQNEDDRSKYQRKKISFELFEAKDEPIPIVGQIRLPHGQRILEQLNLPTPPTPSFLPIRDQSTSNNKKDKNNTFIVQQQVFLQILRQQLVNKIHYGCRITDIVRLIQPSSSTSSCCCLFYLKTTTNNSGGHTRTTTRSRIWSI